jgi:CBS-domain-containing membrane protein
VLVSSDILFGILHLERNLERRNMLVKYFGKMKGGAKRPPGVSSLEIFWSWAGGLVGIGAVAFLDDHFFAGTDLLLLLPPFGASAVLIFGAIKSPPAQPINFVGGHIVSAFVGVSVCQILHPWLWLAAGVAVATSIAAMHATRTLHPPGGATALIAVIGGEKIHSLGYYYVLMPVAAGVLILLVVALLVNNIPGSRKYPEFWI